MIPTHPRPSPSGTPSPLRRLVIGALAAPACLLPRRAPAQDLFPFSVEDRVNLALSRHKSGFHCSQSVLAAYTDVLSWSEDKALKVGAALAGGSTVGGECGAIGAGYLVLGARHGVAVPVFGDVEREAELFGRIRRLLDEFKRRHGAISCSDLLGLDVFTREGLLEGRTTGRFARQCPGYIRDVVTILESMG